MSINSLIPLDRYSSSSCLVRVTAWVLRFVCNSRTRRCGKAHSSGYLSAAELNAAETRWLKSLRKKKAIPTASSLRTLHPFFDNLGILRVGGRLTNSQIAYSQRHLVTLSGQHPLTKLIIRAGHARLFHAGPTLVSFSLRRRFHIIRICNAVRSITRACVVCRRTSARPQP